MTVKPNKVKTMSKRIKAPFYTEERTGLVGLYNRTRLPEGYLYSSGRYKTKIAPKDIPKHYVYGMIYKVQGYISIKGIKDIVYRPNYHSVHLFRDDMLYVSYDKPITSKENRYGTLDYFDYDALLWGPMIVDFIRAVRKYKSYDIEQIYEDVKNKQQFYRARFPEECERPGIDWLE